MLYSIILRLYEYSLRPMECNDGLLLVSKHAVYGVQYRQNEKPSEQSVAWVVDRHKEEWDKTLDTLAALKKSLFATEQEAEPDGSGYAMIRRPNWSTGSAVSNLVLQAMVDEIALRAVLHEFHPNDYPIK